VPTDNLKRKDVCARHPVHGGTDLAHGAVKLASPRISLLEYFRHSPLGWSPVWHLSEILLHVNWSWLISIFVLLYHFWRLSDRFTEPLEFE